MARKLGELLVAEGRISEGVLARALHLQGAQARGWRLGAILLHWGLLPEGSLLDALAKQHRCPAVDWSTLSAAGKDAVKLLSATQSARLSAVPYAADRKTISVAFANPSNLAAIDEVQAITGRRVIPAVTTEVRLLQAQQCFYQQPLARDVWMILQKIEKPQPRESTPAPQPRPPASVQPAEEDGFAEDLLEPAGPELSESIKGPAQSLATEGYSDRAEQTNPKAPGDPPDLEGLPSLLEEPSIADHLAQRLDPFADDTPLAEFIEQALSFYETHPTFRSALAALGDESVEELDPSLEQERPPRGFSLDSTLPSPRRGKRDFAAN